MIITPNAVSVLKNLTEPHDLYVKISLESSACCKMPVSMLDRKKAEDSYTLIEGIPVLFEESILPYEDQVVIDFVNGQIVTLLQKNECKLSS